MNAFPGENLIAPEDRLLLFCARQDFHDQYKQAVLDLIQTNTLRWELIFRTAQRHGIAPLLYRNLFQQLGVGAYLPSRIAGKFIAYVSRYTVISEKRAHALVDVLRFLESRSLSAMLVKGEALNLQVYECSWYTEIKDVDLVVSCRQEELNEAQWLEIVSRGQQRPDFGMEYDFFTHHDVSMNGVAPVDFARIWRDASQELFRGQPVYLMSPEDLLISLCINSCRKRYFRLKCILDIAETVHKFHDLNWEVLVEKARSYDSQIFVYTALSVVQSTLGCSLPNHLLDSLGLNPVRKAIIQKALRFYMLPRLSFASFPDSGFKVLGRPLNFALIFVYLTCRFYQVFRKLNHVLESLDPERRIPQYRLAR